MRSVTSAQIVLIALAISICTYTISFPAAAQPACSGAGQNICAGVCVNLANDLQNCGDCGVTCRSNQICTAGSCTAAGLSSVFACKFTSGKLNGTTDSPMLSGPVSAFCTDNYDSSGTQVSAVFACQFTVGPMAGKTVVPTGITLFGPVGQPCTDNYGNSGTQVISP
jgi:hypothetical protein